MSTSVTDKLRRICDRWVGRDDDTMTTPGHCECVGIINGDIDECPWCAFRRVDALLVDVAALDACAKKAERERDEADLLAQSRKHALDDSLVRVQELEDRLDLLQGAIESAIADGRWSEWSRFGSRAEAVRHDLECALEESR